MKDHADIEALERLSSIARQRYYIFLIDFGQLNFWQRIALSVPITGLVVGSSRGS